MQSWDAFTQLLPVLRNWAPGYIRCWSDPESSSLWAEESVCFYGILRSCSHMWSHRRTDVFSCALTPSPAVRKIHLNPWFQFTQYLILPSNNTQGLVFATCRTRSGSAEVRNSLGRPCTVQTLLLCKSLEKLVIICRFEHTWALWGVLRPSWLEEKYRQKCENVGSLQCRLALLLPFLTILSGKLLHEMIRTPNVAETALLLETYGVFFSFFLVFRFNTFSFFQLYAK